jgi:hypothetical protein
MNSRTQEQLAVLTPDIAVRWMKLRACGTPDPGPDAEPTPLCLLLCLSAVLEERVVISHATWIDALECNESRGQPNKIHRGQ